LSYLNKLFDYGYQAFFEKCQELDVNGVVIPDLPYEERGEIADLAEGHGVSIIPLVAPTSGDRIQKIVKDSTGFVYLVSSLGITGVRDDNEMSHDLSASVAEIKKYTDAPVAVGFGIHTPEQVEKMNEIADGAIIGSGIVKLVENNPDNASAAIEEYVKAIKA
jgi:tryptophan synthase alpha chain